jgi:hypothetical protein
MPKPWEVQYESTEEKPKPWERQYDAAPEEEISQLESGIRGAAQGLTLGFADEIEAKYQATVSGNSYEDTLAEVRQRNAEAQRANPWTYGASAVGTSLLPGGVAAKAVGTIAKGAIGAFGTGAAVGAVEGVGASEKSLKDDYKDLAGEAIVGGALGGALGLVGTAVSKGAKALKPSKLRESALKLTPTEKRARLKSPSLSQLDRDAIQMAENLGAWGSTVDDSIIKVQKIKKLTGKNLKDTAKDLPEIFGDDIKFTQKVLDTVDDHKARFKDSMMQNKYRFDAKGGESAMKEIDDIFSNLHGDLDKTKNALSSVRALRQNLQKELKSSDFMPGGRRSASKDAVYELQKSIRKLESDLVGAYKANPNISPSSLNKLDAYEQSMDQFSKLAHLEDLLIKTSDAGGKLLNTDDGIYFYLDTTTGAAKKTYDIARMPAAKVGVAKGIEGAKNITPEMVKKAAERLKVPVEVLIKLVNKGKISASALTLGEVTGDK